MESVGATPKKMLLILHGAKETPTLVNQKTKQSFQELGSQYRIIFPIGIDKQWNDGRYESNEVDDLSFIEELANRYSCDKTTLIGFSNGGIFAHYFAAQTKLSFENVITIGAAAPINIIKTNHNIYNVYLIQGKKDGIIYFDGCEPRKTMSLPKTESFWTENGSHVITHYVEEGRHEWDLKIGFSITDYILGQGI
jgi:predicted esterase